MTPVQRGAWFDRGVIAALLVVAVALYWAFYALGGVPLVIGIAVVVAYAIVGVGWWLHTWSDRHGAK